MGWGKNYRFLGSIYNPALFISFGYNSHRVRDVQLCPRHCLSWPSQWVPRSIRGRFVCLRRSWGRGLWRPRRRPRRPRKRPARSCPWYFSEGPCGPADGSRQGLIAIAQDAIRHTKEALSLIWLHTLDYTVNYEQLSQEVTFKLLLLCIGTANSLSSLVLNTGHSEHNFLKKWRPRYTFP